MNAEQGPQRPGALQNGLHGVHTPCHELDGDEQGAPSEQHVVRRLDRFIRACSSAASRRRSRLVVAIYQAAFFRRGIKLVTRNSSALESIRAQIQGVARYRDGLLQRIVELR
jgi:hypothetical protein